MVLKCAFPGCPNRQKPVKVRKSALLTSADEMLTFHTFPVNDSERLKLWLLAVRRDADFPRRYVQQMKLCSEHFTSDDFKPCRGKKRRFLKTTAVPKLSVRNTQGSPEKKNAPTLVWTCSEVEERPHLKAVKSPQTPQGPEIMSGEVLMNTQYLLELQSAEPTEIKHTLKQEEVVVQTLASGTECSEQSYEQVLTDDDGSCLSSSDEDDKESVKKTKKQKRKRHDSSDEWEPCVNEEASDSDGSMDGVLKEDGQGKLVVWCTQCETRASLSCSVLRHKKVFCCAQCSAVDDIQTLCMETLPVRFDDVIGFQEHAEREHGADPFYMLCQDCGKFFVADKEHVCEHKMKLVVCPECGKRFLSAGGLKSHCTKLHSDYDHPCKYCLKVFKTRSAKLEHEQTHPKERQPFCCPDCPTRFDNILKRNKHVKSHRGPRKRVCDVCKKGFKDISRLNRHKLIHSGEKPFKCQVCERSFNQMENLSAHMRIHTGEKPFACEQCGETFSHNISLKNHKQKHHDSGSTRVRLG